MLRTSSDRSGPGLDQSNRISRWTGRTDPYLRPGQYGPLASLQLHPSLSIEYHTLIGLQHKGMLQTFWKGRYRLTLNNTVDFFC